jgi:ferredoxin
MKVSVDSQVCIGCTLCVQLCPGVFKMQEDKSVAYQKPVLQENHECSRQAAEQCPVQAISVAS